MTDIRIRPRAAARQDGELLVLRLTPPDTDVVEQAAAFAG